MAARLLVVAAVLNVALAYTDTLPVVAWSSTTSPSLASLPSRLSKGFHSSSLLESILGQEDVCSHDAVIIVEHPGLRASDLRGVSPAFHFAKELSSSSDARQYPYVRAHHQMDINSIAEELATKCESRLHQINGGENEYVYADPERKHVISIQMPHLHQSGKDRTETMRDHAFMLSDDLFALGHALPNHLVIYTGALLPSSMSKRQAPDVPERPTLAFGSLAANTTLPQGGILKRYQLLTPEIITTLLVVLFILLPITLGGMNALASIQNPIRLDAPKSFNAQERKNQ